MEWTRAVIKDHNLIQVPENWLYLHYYEALTILFRIENALRVFVFIILKNEFQEKWCDQSLTSDDSDQGSIKSIARKRMEQAKTFGYLGYPITCPLMHLTSGELIRLIISEAYWKYFTKYFSGSRDMFKNKLDEIGNIRNSLAHFRPIKQDDVDVVKQNSKQVLSLIEKRLSELLTCRNVVPTNTEEYWYTELNGLASAIDYCRLSFSQSGDEQWVKIKMRYTCPIIDKTSYGKTYFTYRVLNIISSSVLKHYPLLSKYTIYVSESTPYVNMGRDYKPNYRKDMKFLFSRRVLAEHHEEIKPEFHKLLRQIGEETELITQDNLAMGEIVHAIDASAYLQETDQGSHWRIGTSDFHDDVKEEDPPEFWGDFDLLTEDFVSAIHKYPWMPAAISEIIVPF